MSVLVFDFFNRSAADLTASPSGRYGAPAGGGGTNAWSVDGQYARTATSFGLSTRGQLRWTGYSPGVDFGELRARLSRGTANVLELGVFVRAHRTNTGLHERLAWVWNGNVSPTRWELRSYSAYGTYFLIQAFPDTGASGSGFSMGLGVFHDVAFRWTSIPNAPGLISMRAQVDTTFFSLPLWPDTWAGLSGGLAAYRGFGLEVLTGASFAGATDAAYFDNLEFDDLFVPNSEPAPTLAADPAVSAITVSAEAAAVDALPFTPDIGERVTKQWFTERFPLDSGHEATFLRFTAGRTTYAIGHSALTKAEAATLGAFLDAHGGPEVPFSYTNDSGVTVKAHFLTDTFAFTRYGVDNVRVEYLIQDLV